MAQYESHLANAMIVFVASLLAAALLIAVFNGPVEQLLAAGAAVGSSSEAEAGRNVIEQSWALAPIMVVLLGLIQLIGAAAAESG